MLLGTGLLFVFTFIFAMEANFTGTKDDFTGAIEAVVATEDFTGAVEAVVPWPFFDDFTGAVEAVVATEDFTGAAEAVVPWPFFV
jgi:hypothetical protein